MDYDTVSDGSGDSPSPSVIYYNSVPRCYSVEINPLARNSPNATSSSSSSQNEEVKIIRHLSIDEIANATGNVLPLIYNHCDVNSIFNVEIKTVAEDVCQPQGIETTGTATQITSIPETVSTLVFFDLETTGLGREIGNSNVHITELSMLAVAVEEFKKSKYPDLKDVRVINKVSICVRPRYPVSWGAAKITGLDSEKLMQQQFFDANTAQMLNYFLARLPHPVCLLAHNGNCFDFPLLQAEYRRLNMQLPPNVFIVDTLSAFRTFGIYDCSTAVNETDSVKKKVARTKYKSYSLQNIYTHFFKKKAQNSHNSEGDCTALMMVCHKVKEQFLVWIDKNKRLFESVVPMW